MSGEESNSSKLLLLCASLIFLLYKCITHMACCRDSQRDQVHRPWIEFFICFHCFLAQSGEVSEGALFIKRSLEMASFYLRNKNGILRLVQPCSSQARTLPIAIRWEPHSGLWLSPEDRKRKGRRWKETQVTWKQDTSRLGGPGEFSPP